jgi:hypothetical protein
MDGPKTGFAALRARVESGSRAILRAWFHVAAWLITLVFGVGMLLLWRVPLAAQQHNVDPLYVVLRGLDHHETEPLYLLKGYRAAVAPVVIEPLRNLSSNKTPSAIAPQRDVSPDRVETVQKGPYEFEHTIYEAGCQGEQGTKPLRVTSTTPHTMIPPEQLLAARRGLDAIYPPQHAAARQQLRDWGETLFLQWWSKQPERRGETHVPVYPERGTEEEHLWFAWQKLTDGSAQTAADLPRLAALARAAYLHEADYRAAVAWAQAWHARQQDHFERHRSWLESQGASRDEELLVQSFQTVLPPATEATWHWLLYQHIGLNDASRRAARERWLALVGCRKLDTALHWGRELQRERRDKGEPLPPASDEVALLCVVERLAGMDDLGQRCRAACRQAVGEDLLISLSVRSALQIAYPSDDVYYVVCGGNPLELGVYGDMADLGVLGQNACLLLLVAAISWYFRTWLLDSFGAVMLWLRRNPVFIQYRERETAVTWDLKGLLCSYVLVPLVLWALAWCTLSKPAQMMVATPWHLLGGVYISVLVGGTAIVCLNRFISLLLIRFGCDVENAWLDDALAVVLGAGMLYYFGNDLISLAAFVAFALLPKLWQRLKLPVVARRFARLAEAA